ncbi:MAG: hypothetical protein GY842_04630 [bacterium]|nr:hypothetical protein [bacterium]
MGRRYAPLATKALVAAFLACTPAWCGCQGFWEQPNANATPASFRVENAASSFVEVTISAANPDAEDSPAETARQTNGTDPGSNGSDPAAERELPNTEAAQDETATTDSDTNAGFEIGDSSGTNSNGFTIGADNSAPPKDDTAILAKTAQAALKTVVAERVVRVSPQESSEGSLSCAQEIVVSATLDGTPTTKVLLVGDGTGTVGFDEGSVGLEGERLLIANQHFECGDTLVVRIEDSATGEITVYAEGVPVPAAEFGTSVTTEADAELIEFRVSNRTASFVELQLSDKPITDAGEDEETEDSAAGASNAIKVRVPSGALTTGVVPCEPQIILLGAIVLPAIDLGSADEFNHAVLTGDGTGTIDFDQNSVGTEAYQRLLLQGTHYECGDIIEIEFTSDGDPAGETPSVGQAGVSVTT